MKSPLRYFGGKNGFGNKILEYFPNNYQFMNYVEPFCGSSAMLFKKERSPIEIINDLDENVYSLFKTLIDENMFLKFKRLCDLSLFSEKIMKEYLIDLKDDNLDIVDRAYKFFYLNRTQYNGTGGFSSSTVIRRNVSKSVSDFLSSIDGLSEAHDRLSSVIIHNSDAFKIIKKYDKDMTFMYLDSPYANETRSSGRYKHDFTDEMQDEYLEILINIKNAKILVSGYNCDRYEILERNGFTRVDMQINTQNNNRKGKSKIESLWMNY